MEEGCRYNYALVNARSLQLECARYCILHESLLVPALTYDSESMIWREKERSRIRPVFWVSGEWIKS